VENEANTVEKQTELCSPSAKQRFAVAL